jgi:hypothetical protein
MTPSPTTSEHGNVPTFLFAEFCEHPEPPEPDGDWSRDDPEWRAHDEWHADHQMGPGGDRICILTPEGSACPACTEAEAEERDLPEGEYIKCQLATARAQSPARPGALARVARWAWAEHRARRITLLILVSPFIIAVLWAAIGVIVFVILSVIGGL